MNFELSEDEEMLKALAERFVSDRYDHDNRRVFLSEPHGFPQLNWRKLGEIGLLAAPLPAVIGGLDLDATAIATIFEALGRGLVVEPLAEAAVLAAGLFARTAPEALRAHWGGSLLTGTKRFALAHAEDGARDGSIWIETSARSEGGEVTLSGSKPYCVAGGGADAYVLSARTSGSASDPEGVALFLLPADSAGLQVREWRLADGSMACALSFDGVRIPADHRLSGGAEAIAEAQDVATLARTAEALGIMERLFSDTLDYLRTREQFGAPLGSFQAIQHRMVAQYAAIEQSRALLNMALVSWGSDRFARTLHGARAFIAEASLTLGHEMIQFHGGMGVTDELAIGGGHKRLLVLSRWPESPLTALDRYAGLLH